MSVRGCINVLLYKLLYSCKGRDSNNKAFIVGIM